MGQDHQAGGDQTELTRDEVAAGEWVCNVCGYVYDEREGAPGDGIAPGTRWQDVSGDWLCPDCGVGKHDFTKMD